MTSNFKIKNSIALDNRYIFKGNYVISYFRSAENRTLFMRELLDLLLPFITAMLNASLTSGHHAIVTPILKKEGIDISDVANYQPISNLSFDSKLTA